MVPRGGNLQSIRPYRQPLPRSGRCRVV